MYWINEYAQSIGFGVFHSGVEVYGVEYAYGGHAFPFSGIFTNTPQDAEELGDTVKFRESVYLGETALSKRAVERLVKSLGDEFRGDRYHLISKNCNHFTEYLARELTGVEIPQWINRLATVSGSIPFLQRLLPPDWLTPIALEQSIENSDGSANNTPTTMNYPASAIDKAEEALTMCGVSPELQPTTSNGHTPQSNGTAFRRASESRSAPSSSRNIASNTAISRIWNSIKNIASDEPTTISRPTNPK